MSSSRSSVEGAAPDRSVSLTDAVQIVLEIWDCEPEGSAPATPCSMQDGSYRTSRPLESLDDVRNREKQKTSA